VRYAYPWGEGELSDSSGPRPWQSEILNAIGEHLKNPEDTLPALLHSGFIGHGIGKSAEGRHAHRLGDEHL
jgi:hypothetical protein